jgi:DNA repair protein RadC
MEKATKFVPVYRVTLVRDGQAIWDRPSLRCATDAAALFRRFLDGVDREKFLVAHLDAKHRPIGIELVSVGSLTASIVHPREVFKAAVLQNAAAVILCHNHPSGDSAPSPEDMAITSRLCEAGEVLGIRVLDHVIIGDGTGAVYSFADAGALR